MKENILYSESLKSPLATKNIKNMFLKSYPTVMDDKCMRKKHFITVLSASSQPKVVLIGWVGNS